jgi:1,4-alpha-glucan branching enzyme
MKKSHLIIGVIAGVMAILTSCKTQPTEQIKARYPDWVKSAVIYEVNTRQFTPEGTFKAFETHLPRLKDLGVDILWFMPIHPIGLENVKSRKE